MKVGIMQPYFFPYLGYVSLIKHTDLFILLDTVQYIRHGWIERNRTLKPDSGWQYIRAPLHKHSRETQISEIQINNGEPWKARILAQLQHYKKAAPYYTAVIELLKKAFSREFTGITDLNRAGLKCVCDYLGIQASLPVFSTMGMQIAPPQEPDEWALNICRAIPGATEYWNPPGGMSFFNPRKYSEAGIALRFHKIVELPYDQRRGGFEPGLSVLDALMFNSPKAVNDMLDRYELSGNSLSAGNSDTIGCLKTPDQLR